MFETKQIRKEIQETKAFNRDLKNLKHYLRRTERRSKRPLIPEKYPFKNNDIRSQPIYQEYYLYGCGLIKQINHYIQLEVINEETFKEKIYELIDISKKCTFPQNAEMMYKALLMYQKLQVQPEVKYADRWELAWKWIEGVKNSDQRIKGRTFKDLLIFDRVDCMVCFILRFRQIKQMVMNTFFEVLQNIVTLGCSNITNLLKKEQQQCKNNLIFINQTLSAFQISSSVRSIIKRRRDSNKRVTGKSGGRSIESSSSISSQSFKERISNFKEKTKRESYMNKLVNLRNKVRQSTMKQSHKSGDLKRISTRWGNKSEQVAKKKPSLMFHISEKQENILHLSQSVKKSEISSSNPDTDTIVKTVYENIQIMPQKSTKTLLRSFYFFIEIQHKLRAIETTKVSIKKQNTFRYLQLQFSGFIRQSLSYRINGSIIEPYCTSEEKILQFLANFLCLKRKNDIFYFFQTKLAPQVAISQTKNVIKYKEKSYKIVFSFIRKFNVYFFASLKYTLKEKKGELSIYDKNYQQKYDSKVVDVKQPELFYVKECEEEEYIEQEGKKAVIEIKNTLIKPEPYHHWKTLFESPKKKFTSSRSWIEVIKISPNFYNLMTHEYNRYSNKFSLTNLRHEHSPKRLHFQTIQNAFHYGSYDLYMNEREKRVFKKEYLKQIQKKKAGENAFVALDIRGKRSKWVKVHCTWTAIKRMRKFGYAQIRIVVPLRNVRNLVLTIAYIPIIGRYYYFELHDHLTDTLNPENLRLLLQKIQLVFISFQNLPFLLLNNTKIMGSQVLCMRSFYKPETNDLSFLNLYTLNRTHTEPIKIKNIIMEITDKLGNKRMQCLTFNKQILNVEERYRKCEKWVRQKMLEITPEALRKVEKTSKKKKVFVIINNLLGILETKSMKCYTLKNRKKEPLSIPLTESCQKMSKKAILHYFKRNVKNIT